MTYKYLKNDATGQVFAYAGDGSQDEYIAPGLRDMTSEEIEQHLNPVPAYWTDGSSLVLTAGVVPGWRLATPIEINVLKPALLVQDAKIKAESLRAAADYAITPLQDAVDLDDATEAEVTTLKAWKQYRVALNRVSEQSGYPNEIEWPAPPA
ncbi:tail fiber assembly protein [Pseudomonas sp.]|uniref:tail fiber assembly protein n=1 Tax=Pseudomonas sp. TaxID=306 RepID=UPI0028AD5A83|nr:tail fiber assembly protein [Pseudomonas sp.]